MRQPVILSIRSLNKLRILLLTALVCLTACTGATKAKTPPTMEISAAGGSFPQERRLPFAVFPLENLSGKAAPLKTIRENLIGHLKKRGFAVIDEETLERFMVKNRVRYTGGVDRDALQTLKNETGAEGVLLTSLELFSETAPPKVALTSRLVVAGDMPAIAWMDGVAMAGNDAPGLLDVGFIEDAQLLMDKVLDKLTVSLAERRSGKKEWTDGPAKKTFGPKSTYFSPLLDFGRKYTVAVLPFFNRSERKYAGDIMVLHFLKNLQQWKNVTVIEPGLIRNALLSLRMIMEDGISLPNVSALFSELGADLIMTGKVMDYQDNEGIEGRPKVNFAVQMIDRKSQQVFWSSLSYNEGDDAVFLFDWGRVNTAHALTSAMIRSIRTMINKER
jgi:TolB-like protein